MKCVGQYMHLGLAPGNHFSIHPDKTIAIGQTHHTTPVNSLVLQLRGGKQRRPRFGDRGPQVNKALRRHYARLLL